MREFNTALLEKWCWRMLVDRGDLWYRVLVAGYGEDVGRLEDGGLELFFVVVGGCENSCW